LDHPERTAVIHIGPADWRRAAIVEFIAAYHARRGISPTVREIGAAVGLRSVSSVHAHLVLLQQSGLIVMTRYTQRSIRVVQR
jgi:repressor LexA